MFCAYITTGAINIQVHRLGVVNAVQIQHSSYNLVAELLVNVLAKENNPFTILH